RTAEALANEMLYLKFVQGLPVVGILGGASDLVYQRKISEYAQLKYKRRFFCKMKKNGESHFTYS
ncbi:MAG: EcsC family protein, partial [Lachnospiraceae bacterium]|nr:EcsC family protein [Lachnospiraceae bacterium]